jgi:hypothetical protein
MRPVEEAPSWARFDDDLPALPTTRPGAWNGPDLDDTSLEYTELADTPRVNGHASRSAAKSTPEALPGYESMTIAQLRGKLRSLTVEEVAELLAFEEAHADRPPFVTMLSNRIATLNAQ